MGARAVVEVPGYAVMPEEVVVRLDSGRSGLSTVAHPVASGGPWPGRSWVRLNLLEE
jgi:hypothetical protein